MKTQVLSGAFAALFGAALVTAQAPTGPSLQAPADPRYKSVIDTCKTPPPAPAAVAAVRCGRRPRRSASGPRLPVNPRSPRFPASSRPGEVDQGVGGQRQQRRRIVGTPDGGLLIAQNDNAQVMELDRDGKTSVAYKDTNTGGALSLSPRGSSGACSAASAPPSGSWHPSARCTRTGSTATRSSASRRDQRHHRRQQGRRLLHDGRAVLLRRQRHRDALRRVPADQRRAASRDEKTLFVTNGQSVAAFDVQPNGALTNQREFVAFPGGGGDDTIDSEGPIDVTGEIGPPVAGPDGWTWDRSRRRRG